jgi:pSer/pThr/pTyr-binding forkhead associated (FHA) protein
MVLCSDCHHRDILGAIFCSECGERLIYPAMKGINQNLDVSPESVSRDVDIVYSKRQPKKGREPFISLLIINNGQVIPLIGREEFTLGRYDSNQPLQPDVDLNPHDAYQSGVSRLHASIRIDQQVTLQDLGSSNGTRINGQEIPANVPLPLSHGDVLTLGTLNIQVFIHT